jgi:hypothetical protein
LRVLYRTLLVLAVALGGIILGGTLYAAFRDSGSAGGGAGQGPAAPGTGETAGEAVFTGIGRLRIPLASPGESGGMGGGTGRSPGPGDMSAGAQAALVLSIAFPYPARDRAFTEELASRVGDFRRITREYFSARSPEELRGMDEKTMKAELLRAYNAVLRLGNIETLYFNDLLLFE